MTIKITVCGLVETIRYSPKISTFPGGEQHVNVFNPDIPEGVVMSLHVESIVKNSTDLVNTILVCDAVTREYKMKPVLVLRYLPYARQDRVCNRGEAFGKKVVLDMLNQVCNSIVTHDCHSDVFSKEYHNVEQHILIESSPVASLLKDKYVVAPDKGSKNKAQKLLDNNMCKGVFFGDKVRDASTGKLSGFDVDCEDFEGKDLVIVDDICDGGGTFLGLGKLLRERKCGRLYLYVTHGIFSQGYEELDKVFDGVYCSPSLRPVHIDWKPVRKEEIWW